MPAHDPVTILAKRRVSEGPFEWDALPPHLRAKALDTARRHFEEVKAAEAEAKEATDA